MAHHFKLRISVEIRVLKIRVKFVDKYFPLSPLCLFQTQIVKTLTLKLRARTPQLKSRYTSTQIHFNPFPQTQKLLLNDLLAQDINISR